MTVIIRSDITLHVCREPPFTWTFYDINILCNNDVTFLSIPTRFNTVKNTKVNYTFNLYEDEDNCKIEVDGRLSSVRPN